MRLKWPRLDGRDERTGGLAVISLKTVFSPSSYRRGPALMNLVKTRPLGVSFLPTGQFQFWGAGTLFAITNHRRFMARIPNGRSETAQQTME